MIDKLLSDHSIQSRGRNWIRKHGTELWATIAEVYGSTGQPPNGTGYVHRGSRRGAIAATENPREFSEHRYRLISIDAKTGKPTRPFGDQRRPAILAKGWLWQIKKMHYTAKNGPPVIYKEP